MLTSLDAKTRWLLVFAALGLMALPTFSPAAAPGDPAAEKAALGREHSTRVRMAAIALSSNYVEAAVASSGNFTLGTRIGDPDNPNDDNKRMLYGHPNPWSGATTLRIDGQDFCNKNNNAIGATIQAPLTTDNVNVTVWQQGDVQLTQKLEIVSGSSTGRLDTLLMEYTAQNLGSSPHNVGVRVLLDTWLGATDGAPFRVPAWAT
jgi:hypothetical protein